MTNHTLNPDNVEIEIDTDEKLQAITLTLNLDDKQIMIGLHLPEAQQLSTMLHEAVTNLMLTQLGLPPLTPETRH